MSGRHQVLLIGDSNIRKVVQTKELEDLDHIEAAGCSFWNPDVKKWRDRVQDPLMRRLRRTPEVKVLVIHFGTCDDQKDQTEFINGVEAFVGMVRAEFERISFVISEVLPRQESFIDRYNSKDEARFFNLLQSFLNMELIDLTEKMPRCSLVKHSVLDQLDKKLYWSDSVHLSSWGARLLAKDLDDAIEEALAEVARFEEVRPGSSRSRYWEENASLLEQEPCSQLPKRRKLPELPHYEKKAKPRRHYRPTPAPAVTASPECWDDDDHPHFPPIKVAKPVEEDDHDKHQLNAWEVYQLRQKQRREQAERMREEEEKARLQRKNLKSGSSWTKGCSRGKNNQEPPMTESSLLPNKSSPRSSIDVSLLQLPRSRSLEHSPMLQSRQRSSSPSSQKSRSSSTSSSTSHSPRRSRTPNRNRVCLDEHKEYIGRRQSRCSMSPRDISPKGRSLDGHSCSRPSIHPTLSPKPRREPRARRRRDFHTVITESSRRSHTPKPQHEPRIHHRRPPYSPPRTTRSLSYDTKGHNRGSSPSQQRESFMYRSMMPRVQGINTPPRTTTKRHLPLEAHESSSKIQRTLSIQPQVHVRFHKDRETGGPIQGSKNLCVFAECTKVSPPNHNEAKHFFKFHMPFHLRHGDTLRFMPSWALFIIGIIDILGLYSLEDLLDEVRSNGWFPANRSLKYTKGQVGRHDKTMVDAFANYINIPNPQDYSETNPKSLALLVNWRIIRAIMRHGLNYQQRQDLLFMKRARYNPVIPRRQY